MKNHWLDKKLKIAVIERNGNEIRFTLSNSHVWKFNLLGEYNVLQYCRIDPLRSVRVMAVDYICEYELCREKAWEIFNGKITSSQ